VFTPFAGAKHIRKQISHGLVAVIKGPEARNLLGPSVYLEVNYKHGEWNVREGFSKYVLDAMDELEREMEEDKGTEAWKKLPEEHRKDLALERSQQNVSEQQGWGAVLRVPGRLLGRA
jgi:hypothetical protein